MLNMNAFVTEVRDNTVVINGASFKVTDEVALKILALIKGDEVKLDHSPVSEKQNKKASAPVKKGLTNVQYHIKKHGNTFCISRGVPYTTKNGRESLKNGGWTTAEKRCINTAIKSLEGIKTVKVPMENGRSFSAWGFSTKKAAEAAMKTLPTSFSAEEVAKFERTRQGSLPNSRHRDSGYFS